MKGLVSIVLLFGALLLGGLAVLGSVTNAAADISASLAEIEQARAYREAAAANHTAIRALGAVTILDRLQDILLVVLSLALVGLAAWIWYQNVRLKRAQAALAAAAQERPRWVPGPNAGWKKLNADEPRQPAALPNSQEVMALAMLSLVASLARSQGVQPPAYPAQTVNTPPVLDAVSNQPLPPANDWDMFN